LLICFATRRCNYAEANDQGVSPLLVQDGFLEFIYRGQAARRRIFSFAKSIAVSWSACVVVFQAGDLGRGQHGGGLEELSIL
jgi:hypothetical protein